MARKIGKRLLEMWWMNCHQKKIDEFGCTVFLLYVYLQLYTMQIVIHYNYCKYFIIRQKIFVYRVIDFLQNLQARKFENRHHFCFCVLLELLVSPLKNTTKNPQNISHTEKLPLAACDKKNLFQLFVSWLYENL